MQRVSANMCYNNVFARATLVARRSSSLSGVMRLPAGQFFTFAMRRARITVHVAESVEPFPSRLPAGIQKRSAADARDDERRDRLSRNYDKATY